MPSVARLARWGRHLVTVAATAWLGSGFPWGTLIVNVAGSFLLGVLVALLSAVWTPPGEVRLFLVTGFLGAFTTFSAFSLDVVSEFERGHNSLAILYVVASVVLFGPGASGRSSPHAPGSRMTAVTYLTVTDARRRHAP